jgi:hypothetical protein
MTTAQFPAARVAAAARRRLEQWTDRRSEATLRLELLRAFAEAAEGPINLSVDDFMLIQSTFGGA